MTRYAVGDLQGCFEPLQRLLQQVAFDPARDQLWAVGDLVNRGPDSLACLRFMRALGDSGRIVLGNHDLHLLAVAAGIRPLKRGDTLQPILDAPDSGDLLGWLSCQPLFYRDPAGDYSMVHAGLAPQWSLEQAQALSDEISAVLRSADRNRYLSEMYGNTPDQWSDSLCGPARWRLITNYFTRMRTCDAQGRLDLRNKGAPDSANAGFMPWFDAPQRKSSGYPILFGHWAALRGRTQRDDAIGLDTGCVWGEQLTLFDLDQRRLHQCNCRDDCSLS